MPPDDNIFDDKTPKDDKKPDPSGERFDKLERSVGQLGSSLAQFAEQVTAGMTKLQTPPAPQAPKTPSPSSDELAQAFLTDPERAIEDLLKRRPDLVKTIAREQIVADVGPYVQNDVSEKFQNFTDGARARIDGSYGPGTYDEVLAPKIEAIYKTMDQSGAGIGRGVRSTFDAVLRQASGDDDTIQALWERKQTFDKKRTAPDMIEGGTAPRPKTQLTEGDRAFLAGYEKATGYKLDGKALLDTLGKYEPGVGWTAASVGSKNRLKFEDAR